MIEDIKKLKYKYIALINMNRISKNCCSSDDYLYSNFLLGQSNILNSILNDLDEMIERYDKK